MRTGLAHETLPDDEPRTDDEGPDSAESDEGEGEPAMAGESAS